MEQVTINVPDDSANLQSGATLSWKGLTYAVPVGKKKDLKMRTLLDNINGIVKPGNVTAILGPSGSGKTTLLNVLAGRISDAGSLDGEVLVNGQFRSKSNWQKIVGYVEQDDILYENLTVKETIMYAALLRLPHKNGDKSVVQDKRQRVDALIKELSLTKCQDTRIGNSEMRGISGGERKRVSIAVELITQPQILFLDECTSGLDSFTASNIVQTIKKIAVDNNKTVVMTIHQPREFILTLFDSIVLLSEGKNVYSGDVQGAVDHFANCGFKIPANTNPADFFLDTMTIDLRNDELKEQSMARNKTLQTAWQPQEVSSGVRRTSSTKGGSLMWPNTFMHEFMVLFQRNVQDVLRDKATLGATFGQSIVNIILVGFVFFRMGTDYTGIQNRVGSLFFICINLSFSNVMPLIAVFTLQRNVVKKERASGTYRAISAYLAKTLSQLPLVILSTLLFGIPLYWMIGLKNSITAYLIFLLTLCVHTITASLLGIAVSSGAANVRTAQIIAPLVIVLFFIFAGQLVNLDSVTPVLSWIKWISFLRYTYSSLAMNEFKGLNFGCQNGPPNCQISGESVLDQFALSAFDSLWYNLIVNAGIAVMFLVVGFLLFQWKSSPLMRLK